MTNKKQKLYQLIKTLNANELDMVIAYTHFRQYWRKTKGSSGDRRRGQKDNINQTKK